MVRRREVLFRDDGSNDGSNTERVQRERVQREKRRYTRRDANLLQSEMNESNSILLRVKKRISSSSSFHSFSPFYLLLNQRRTFFLDSSV